MSATVTQSPAGSDGVISTERLTALASLANWSGKGFAISATSGFEMRAGYAVSVHPERGQRIGDRVTARDLMEYIRAHWDLLGKPGVVLRARRDRNTGVAFLDVAAVVHNRERARMLARAHGQRGVLDLRSGCAVRV